MEKKTGNTVRTLAVEICDLTYKVASKQILDHVSIVADNHEFIGLIGPNGSGKTSILRHIYKALPIEKNVIFIGGKDQHEITSKESARQIAVMRQESATDFEYTVGEMVLMGRAPYRKYYEADTAEDERASISALKCVGMSKSVGQSISTLSGGEKQRVMIARAIAQDTDILILDEPTNHLDLYYQWSIMELIRNLNKTVIAVFHELNLACQFCNRIYVLNEGKIVADGSPAEVCTKKMLAEVFQIDADIIADDIGRPTIICRKAIT